MVTVLVASVSMWTGTALATTRCEDLAKLSLADTTITSATSVAAGKFVTAFVSRHTLSEMWMWYATHQEPAA
jgi:hypothetical protein